MALAPGTRVGAYEITGQLGAGGMGEVYRARDSQLKRDVAIKVLPEDVANDPERLARFQREAEVLASLNHPHIAHVYGIDDGALVMELVEGEDLSQRIARGPIPIDEAVPIAKQIAEALEAAHDAGIIHRDLKPANIKVRDDGTVKVLDFGLAKVLAPQDPKTSRPQDLSNSPTITSPAMTARGVVLGTAAYMSPEQAKGKFVDRRADIWAFGCVLYEMLTGTRAFVGDDLSDTLVSILRDDPRWDSLSADTPPHVRQLLRRCLQKDPQKRLPHIGVARLELADPDTGLLVRGMAAPSRRWHLVAATVAGAAVAGFAVFGALWRETGDPASVRFTIEAPDGHIFPGAQSVPRFALSPDGRRIAYQLQDQTRAQLFIRLLDTLDAEPVLGSESALDGAQSQGPFWSPNGRYLAFFDETLSLLKKHDSETKVTQVVTEVPGIQLAGTWNDDGVIAFSSMATGGLRRVLSSGQEPTQLTTISKSNGEIAHLWPDFLPGGRHLIYLALHGNNRPTALYVAALHGTPPKRLLEGTTMARVAAPDRLLFARDGALLSQRLDLQRLELVGEPELIASDPPVTSSARLGVSASRDGNVIAYSEGADVSSLPYGTEWVDRTGKPVTPSPPSIRTGPSGIRLARGGRHLLYHRLNTYSRGQQGTSLWLQDVTRGIETQISNEAVGGAPPIVSADGSRVFFRQLAGITYSIVSQPMTAAAPPEVVFEGDPGESLVPMDVSADGRLIFYRGRRIDSASTVAGQGALWIVPAAADGKPVLYVTGSFRQGAAVSPDGRWLAYTAASGGNSSQVFVQSFPDPTIAKLAASPLGGSTPRWRADGRELFFIDRGQRLMAAAVSAPPRMEIAGAQPLFELEQRSGPVLVGSNLINRYDVMPDGSRFVILRFLPVSQQSSRIVVHVKR